LTARRTLVQRAAQRRRAAPEQRAQHLALTGRHRGAEAFEISRTMPDQHLVQTHRASEEPTSDDMAAPQRSAMN
jgi:hypothetical protein